MILYTFIQMSNRHKQPNGWNAGKQKCLNVCREFKRNPPFIHANILQEIMRNYMIMVWCWLMSVVFQIGRSTESPIDFVVTDTIAGGQEGEETPITQSTISRFACRVVCERNPPFTARIYAAGFDSSKNIFLGVIMIQCTACLHTGYRISVIDAVVSTVDCHTANQLCHHLCSVSLIGKSRKMEESWRSHGWTDHQWRAGDAP